MDNIRIYIKCSCGAEYEALFADAFELFEKHVIRQHSLKPASATFMKSKRVQL